MKNQNTFPDRSEQFIENLIRLKALKDLGRLAELRRGLSETTRHQAWPTIQFLGGRLDNIVDVTIAGLFAIHPEHCEGPNLGATWRKLRKEQLGSFPSEDKNRGSFEHRFMRLLACSTKEELCEKLRSFITIAKSAGVPINYVTLYRDSKLWELGNSKLFWAQEYWKNISNKQPINHPQLSAEICEEVACHT